MIQNAPDKFQLALLIFVVDKIKLNGVARRLFFYINVAPLDTTTLPRSKSQVVHVSQRGARSFRKYSCSTKRKWTDVGVSYVIQSNHKTYGGAEQQIVQMPQQ